MQLMTKEIERKLPPLRSTENLKPEQVDVVVKFFPPWGKMSWYATEGEKQSNGDWLFYGWVDGDYPELGQWLLSELEQVVGPMGLKIERDRGFKAKLSDVMRDAKKAFLDSHVEVIGVGTKPDFSEEFKKRLLN